MKTQYICPLCAGKLNPIGVRLHCLDCGSLFTVDDGIPILSKDRDFYYGEVSKKLMIKLLRECDSVGWEQALSRLLDAFPDPEFVSHYVLAEKRSSWKFLLNLSPDGRALDLGCGWGATALSLARNYGEVVAADLTLERLRFLQKRCLGSGIENISFVCCGDTDCLPFPNAYFDAVVLNGVLEWVAVSGRGRPKGIQTQYLREVYRILKENGVLYIGIENRYSHEYFRGRPDDHTGLMYGSLMPRITANFYSRHVRGVPYRTYTYSRMGYKKMINRAGFLRSCFFMPVPDYRNFRNIVDLGDKHNITSYFLRDGSKSKLKQKLKSKLAFALSPAYSIVCHKGKKDIFYTDLVNYIAENDLHSPRSDRTVYKIGEYLVGDSAGTVVIKLDIGSRKFVVKLPVCHVGLSYLQHDNTVLGALWKKQPSLGKLLEVIPRPISTNTYRGQPYFVETGIDGNAINDFASEHIYTQLKRQAFEFIKAFHLATKNVLVFTENTYDCQIGYHVQGILAWMDCRHDKLRDVEKYIKATLIGREIPLVWGHGDFWHGNLLFNNSRKLVGVVDWDLSCHKSLPVMDLAHFLCYLCSELKSMTFSSALIQQLFSGELLRAEHDLWQDYCESMGLDQDIDSLRPFFVGHWLIHMGTVTSRSTQHRLSRQWIQGSFYNVLDQIHASIAND